MEPLAASRENYAAKVGEGRGGGAQGQVGIQRLCSAAISDRQRSFYLSPGSALNRQPFSEPGEAVSLTFSISSLEEKKRGWWRRWGGGRGGGVERKESAVGWDSIPDLQGGHR